MSPDKGTLLGAGRSGVVFKQTDDQGRQVACKVFDSDTLTKAVQYAFLGAPNPYAWSEHAVRGAVLRRRVVGALVRHWFGDKLHVATAWGMGWDPEHLAFELYTEFVDGSPPMLHHPLNRRGEGEVRDLLSVMGPLQHHLEDAGFDGLVWQAGRGNPVALANFLRMGPRVRDEDADPHDSRWAWIDLESGVPALFPAQPLELLRYYLPKAWHHRRPLFDDVDGPRLERYLATHGEVLRETLGESTFTALTHDAAKLHGLQEAWRSLPRHRRSIAARLAKQKISGAQAEWFGSRPVRWYLREGASAPGKAVTLVRRKAIRLWAALRPVLVPRTPRLVFRFLTSQRFRYRIAHLFVAARIDAWRRREQLDRDEAARLRANLQEEESSAYLTDFGVHLAIKPFVKFVEYAIFPMLFAAGLIDSVTLAVVLAGGGAMGRTAYTTGRLIQASLHGHERPWVALVTGALPVVGNLAYPTQIVYSSTVEDDILAQFLMYDSCTSLGRKIPIWGGRDTLTEHVFNRLPDALVRRLERTSAS